MNRRTSRFKRDVWSETSVSDRDVSSQRHGSGVTFKRGPSLLSRRPAPARKPAPLTASCHPLHTGIVGDRPDLAGALATLERVRAQRPAVAALLASLRECCTDPTPTERNDER